MSKRKALVLGAVLAGLTGTLVVPSAANAEPGCGAGSYVSGGTYYLTYTNCSGDYVSRKGTITAVGGGTVGQCQTPAPYRTTILATFTPSSNVTGSRINFC